MKAKLTIILAFLLIGVTLSAQEDKNQPFFDANNAFEMGYFVQVDTMLRDRVPLLDREYQIQAYRLLVLSSLYQDKSAQAEVYAAKLLELDPFYAVYGESPRFGELLSKIKKVGSTITTASKMSESVEEVSVPITLITEEMIKASGALKLQDLLIQYVPGISAIQGLEDNVAMRGVYGLGQETILVLLDGHRLNSPTTNSEPFDYRNSLDKIKQIEVLRGPASSLYGNVALTAVVNIITKNGADVDGVSLIGRIGSHNTYNGSALVGKGNMKSEFLIWGSSYMSDGQAYDVGMSTHYVGAYKDSPTFDVGAKIKWDNLVFEICAQQSHPVPFYNLMEIGDTYSYDKYGTVNGLGPGRTTTTFRADLDWSKTWEKFTLSASISGANERQQIYNVLGDTVKYEVMAYLARDLGIGEVKTRGLREIIDWEDFSSNINLSGTYLYKAGEKMSGTVMFGLQYEALIMGDAMLMIGSDFDQTNNVRHNILLNGIEQTASSYLQLKHYFTKRLIFNGGIRFDFKKRIDGRQLQTASPRLSLIWMPSNVVTVKGGYARSFVDAAAFYRGSTISLFSGGTGLNPERMNSYQIGTAFKWKRLGLTYELNAFHNDVRDMVYYNLGASETDSDSSSDASAFVNSGQISMGGFENSLQYRQDRLFLNANLTYQHPFKVESFFSSNANEVGNVPNLLANLTAQYALLVTPKGGRLLVRANAHYQSGFNGVISDYVQKIVGVTDTKTYHQDPYTIVNAGLEWKGAKWLDLSLDIRNITNKYYVLGGQLQNGVPGDARSVIFKAALNF